MYRDALRQAVLEADAAEIQSQRQLDPSVLYARHTGSQLQSTLATVESLRNRGVHIDSRLLNIEWHRFWVSPDERRATVETTETWYSQYHNNEGDTCAAVIPTHDVPQRATLVRVNDVWKISSVSFTGPTPQAEACP
jgi:hypothetical protein